MDKRIFKIELETIFGIKKGEICFLDINGKIRGFIDILHHKNNIEGFLDELGKISFEGNITSLNKVIPIIAEGFISNGNINLLLKSKNNFYKLAGMEVIK